jgi:hypothetical protein
VEVDSYVQGKYTNDNIGRFYEIIPPEAGNLVLAVSRDIRYKYPLKVRDINALFIFRESTFCFRHKWQDSIHLSTD